MSQSGVQVEQRASEIWSPYRLTRFWAVFLLVAAPILAIGGSVAAINWPFRFAKIHPLLEDTFGNQVKIGHYHRTYFPHPGFIATDLTLIRRNADNNLQFGTIETLSVDGKWRDLLMLRDRVRLVEITGLHLQIPAPGKSANSPNQTTRQNNAISNQSLQRSTVEQFDGPSTAIEKLLIHNSLLDILRKTEGRYSFAIRSLEIDGLQKGHRWHYIVDMENPLPAGHIAAAGDFGPLNTNDPGATPASGGFTFNQVKLSDIGILHGTLASTGHFAGPLRALQADASSDTPDFAVDDGQPIPIRGTIHCIVNGLNGDVIMPAVEVTTGRTVVYAHGQVAGSPKLTTLDIDMKNGRAEEVLRPFIHDRVPVLGPASLRSHIFIAAPGKPFLQRLVLEGHFDAPSEKVNDRDTQKSLTDFSRRQTDKSPPKNQIISAPLPNDEVLSSLRGPANIRNGVISTDGLVFAIPGATATMRGIFTLHGESVHMTGELKMDADISHAATGWKSAFLKPLQPFFRRKTHTGSKIPIAVLGSPGHYKVTEDISHNK